MVSVDYRNQMDLAEESSHWEEDDDEVHIREVKADAVAVESGEFNVWEEAKLLFHIAAPSILIQFSLFFIFPQAASAVGRTVGTMELAAFSLGGLIGNMTCLSIMEGSLTAGDTLMPRAFGNHKYEEVARLVVRATIVVCCLLIPPIIPLCFFSENILLFVGQDPEASRLAQIWIRYYFIGVPPNIVYRVALRFLLAQHKPWPHVYTSVFPCLVINPILLKLLVPTMGLAGSGLAISLTQWSMTLLLGLYFYLFHPHKPETWPGLSWKLIGEACEIGPLWTFASLSLGGVFSLSEWWFWEIMCFVAGSFGVYSLVAHTVAYNLVPLLFMLPLGIMIGLAVRMGHVIATEPLKARKLAAYCMGGIVFLATFVVSLLYILRVQIIHLFSLDDEHVLPLSLSIWPFLCAYIWLLYIFGISNAIYRGLGMQWRLAIITTVMLYVFLGPAVFYFAVYKQGGLVAQWHLLPSFYTILQVVLAYGYIVVDWEDHGRKIREGFVESARKTSQATQKLIDSLRGGEDESAELMEEGKPLLAKYGAINNNNHEADDLVDIADDDSKDANGGAAKAFVPNGDLPPVATITTGPFEEKKETVESDNALKVASEALAQAAPAVVAAVVAVATNAVEDVMAKVEAKVEEAIVDTRPDEPTADAPAAESTPAEPTVEKVDEPSTEAPAAPEPEKVEEPAAESVPAEEPAAPESVPAEEPAAAESAPAEEPAAESAPAEEPAAGSATAEEPAAESATAEEPAAESATAEEPAAESATAEEPTAESATAEEPTAESATAKESAAESVPAEGSMPDKDATPPAESSEPATEEEKPADAAPDKS